MAPLYQRPSRAKEVSAKSSEEEILLCCVRPCWDAAAGKCVSTLLKQELQWQKLIGLAEVHGVTPLVYARLFRDFRELIPERIGNSVRYAFVSNAQKNFFVAAELLRLIEIFTSRGITAVPFKGPVLAACAYGDIAFREFGDLDLFVKRNQMARAATVLTSAGYIRPSDQQIEHEIVDDPDAAYLGPKYYVFVHKNHQMRVDLQWRVTQNYFSFPIELLDGRESLICVKLLERDVLTFGPTDLLLILCAHGSKHRWEKLKWICDVAHVVSAYQNQIDWYRLTETASARRIMRMLSLGLFLSKDLLDAPVPSQLLRTIEADAYNTALARKITEKLFGSGDCPTDFARMVFYLRITDTWRDRVHFFLAYLRQFGTAVVVPTRLERSILRLPRGLRFLYVLLRVMRLAAKYGQLGAMRLLVRRNDRAEPMRHSSSPQRSSKSW